jgi:glutamate-1-semialdehyde 2,1-aminomutase
MTTINEQFIQTHTKSAELHKRALAHFPNGVTHDNRNMSPHPLYVTHGKGSRKWDVDGNEYIDWVTGHGSLLLGHSRPEVVKAVQDQMAKASHPGASHEKEIQWAELIKELIPSAEKIRFHSSGTEASLMAFRMVRAYSGKNKIIKFQGHFHGWHDGATPGYTNTVGITKGAISDTIVLPPNDIDLVEKTIKEDKDIAALILEPTGASMGFFPIAPSFLHQLRKVTSDNNIILIFDEVVQGFRASRSGTQGRYGVIPDMTLLAKILAGGLPGGAVTGRADIIDMLAFKDAEWNSNRRIAHPGTFNGKPLSASAGVAALSLIANEPINETAERTAKKLKGGLNQLFTTMEIPGCACGIGATVQLHLGYGHEHTEEQGDEICTLDHDKIRAFNATPVAGRLKVALLNAGVDTNKGVNLLVQSAHTDEDVAKTLSAYERAFKELRTENVLEF